MRQPNQKFAGEVSPDGDWCKWLATLRELDQSSPWQTLGNPWTCLTRKGVSFEPQPWLESISAGSLQHHPNACFLASQGSSFSSSYCLSAHPRERLRATRYRTCKSWLHLVFISCLADCHWGSWGQICLVFSSLIIEHLLNYLMDIYYVPRLLLDSSHLLLLLMLMPTCWDSDY